MGAEDAQGSCRRVPRHRRQLRREASALKEVVAEPMLGQLSNALLEPLFPVAKGIRLLGISLSSLATADAERQRADPDAL